MPGRVPTACAGQLRAHAECASGGVQSMLDRAHSPWAKGPGWLPARRRLSPRRIAPRRVRLLRRATPPPAKCAGVPSAPRSAGAPHLKQRPQRQPANHAGVNPQYRKLFCQGPLTSCSANEVVYASLGEWRGGKARNHQVQKILAQRASKLGHPAVEPILKLI